MEGQWSRRGDIVDVFPVSSELPVRLEWFGDELEQIREFDSHSAQHNSERAQCSGGTALDKIDQLVLTPTNFGPIVRAAVNGKKALTVKAYLSPEEQEQFDAGQQGESPLSGPLTNHFPLGLFTR